ncbi:MULTISPECIES: NAD(P)/FAD-dependent oxidoreductase [Acinetobacter]|jgi:glycine oxidase|uniref:FAD-dependent oxidoreductase n=1 Tax=Acinetobacter radioresistens TaxID=40216 RepID=A0A8H2PRW1_ACIRA|nr:MULTISPECIES: FAD-dependent oxidoreductase [Acinetobacter]ENV86569.1 glycine oxidase ThiO [Acinetobacter radioresistens DSM 6976 = NBRC 102413 = CIP 103788]EXB32285.1 pyridine nucleotide-disulfide oxidoreductase family protein [Acinetobacter sp. 1461402]EXB69859.1 pyridine nucleotide-disulfide oxidoreductase family protein [Acinetobacter sp. 230853]EXC32948.1 pyridine nucleotide-disulfide oxidoreductase family protein [Acinetobacter sp. 869535]EXE15538.1 pyridine nucleotide-disulfide oxidor
MKIAIIGAGISGLLTALELIEQGCSVDIFDQPYSGSASWAGGGILSPMYPWRYAPAVNQLAQFGKALYQEWNQKLQPVSGIDFQIHETGMLIFDQEDFRQGLSYSQQFQEPMQICELVQHERLRQINPHIASGFKEALYFPQLANIRNPRLLQSIQNYLKTHPNVQFFENTAIQQLDIQHGQIVAVRDQNLRSFQADQFVLTTGAWSEQWSRQLNIQLPVQPVHGQMILFKTPENWLPTMCMNRVMYLIPRSDGHIVCGSSMAHQGFNTSINSQTSESILTASLEMVPELAQFPIVKQWAGLRPGSPEGIPYIGKIPDINNLWANFGHFRNGLCMGPASARLLRQLILKQPPLVEPQVYSPERLIPQSYDRVHSTAS